MGGFDESDENSVYILSRYHSDHYDGLQLRKIFTNLIGVINLLNESEKSVEALTMYAKHLIPNSIPTTYVTLMEANYCHGALMFLFEIHSHNNNNNNGITAIIMRAMM